MDYTFKLKRLICSFNFRIYVVVAIFLIVLICFYHKNGKNNFVRSHFNRPTEFRKEIERENLKFRSDGHICLQNRTEFLHKIRTSQFNLTTKWFNIQNITTRDKFVLMSGLYDTRRIPSRMMHYFFSDHEIKFYLPFNDPDASCNVFTFGVGMDYKGEKTFWNRYPQCQMSAVDPVSEINKQMVEEVPNARFIQATVAAYNETRRATIKQINSVYERFMTIDHFGITSFLQQYNGNKTIDLMLIDVEGAEYGILPVLVYEKHLLPTICQINVEIHYSPKSSGYGPIVAFKKFNDFFNDQTYSIFNIEVTRLHMRVFMVNTANSECIEKFFCE